MTEQADLVLKGGRIIDPESGLDENQDIAFKDGKVSALPIRWQQCQQNKSMMFQEKSSPQD